MRLLTTLAAILVAVSLHASGPAPSARENPAGQEVLKRYLEATAAQVSYHRDISMEVEIEANLPSLKKTGTLHALRSIGRLGEITYRAIQYAGDNMIKKDVIARYITAETTSLDKKEDLALTPDNYKFRYYGEYGSGDWRLHLFHLDPRKKRLGLFRGWLWVHAGTALPVRETGEFVKSPSMFLKRVRFTRDYEIRGDVALPKSIESSIETRLVGKAQLSIRFKNFSKKEGGDRGQLAAHLATAESSRLAAASPR